MAIACRLPLTCKLDRLFVGLFGVYLAHKCATAASERLELSSLLTDGIRQTDHENPDEQSIVIGKDNTGTDLTEEGEETELLSTQDLTEEMASSVKSAEHMLDIYFTIVQRSMEQETSSEPHAEGSIMDDAAITLGSLLDFIRRSLEVQANELGSAQCFRLKKASGCRKFTISTAAVHKLYEFVKDRHQGEEEGALTKRMFMEMAFYTYPKKDTEKLALTMRFRELLFLLVHPSAKYDLDKVDSWDPITLTDWEAFLKVHGIPVEGPEGQKFVQRFKNEAEQHEGALQPDHWEDAIEQAQGVREEDLTKSLADTDISEDERADLSEELLMEMNDEAETEHLLSALHIDLEALDSEIEALLEDALHILQIYFHMIDLQDPNNHGFITKADFDAFISKSLNVDANKFTSSTCRKLGRRAPCFKFDLNPKASAKLFLQEMNKMYPESDNKGNLPTFEMSEFQFVEMALQSSCETSKVVESFRRTLFVLINPSTKFTLKDVTKWKPVDSVMFRNFLVLHGVSGAQQDSFVQFFEKITRDTNQVLDVDGMERAIGRAREASGCN